MKPLERITLRLALGLTVVAACHDSIAPVPALAPSDTASTPPASVTLTPATLDTLFYRDTIRVSAMAVDARGRPVASAQVRWSISNSQVVGFVQGVYGGGSYSFTYDTVGPSVLVYPFQDGSAGVAASVGALTQTLTVTVRQKVVGIFIVPNPIIRDSGSGGEDLIYVNAVDSHGGPYYYDKQHQLTLVSSDSAVAVPEVGGCIDGDCGFDHLFVFGVRPGSATITALLATTYGTFTATAPVTVNRLP
jgi:hypothetical protein